MNSRLPARSWFIPIISASGAKDAIAVGSSSTWRSQTSVIVGSKRLEHGLDLGVPEPTEPLGRPEQPRYERVGVCETGLES